LDPELRDRQIRGLTLVAAGILLVLTIRYLLGR
jgi:hypothetical protein